MSSTLADQAKKEHIVEQISPRSVARYLKEADLNDIITEFD
ncbi:MULTISPECIES: hypothetical protein [unclassified Oceanobacillus]|nr:hypothetical protein [Oceanobacillus sp. AG]